MDANATVTDVEEIRRLVATVNRLLYMEGHVGYSGHVSMRHPDTDVVYINPLSASRGEIRPEDVVAVSLDDEPLDPEAAPPVGERPIHTAVYRERDDVTAVLHTHPPTLTLFAITGTDLLPVSQRGSILAEGPVPTFDRPGKVTTREEGDAMVEAMGDAKQVLLANHGAVVCDSTVVRAFARAVFLEKNAEWQHRASSLGSPNPMTQAEVERAYAGNWKESSIEKFWHFYTWKARESGVLPASW